MDVRFKKLIVQIDNIKAHLQGIIPVINSIEVELLSFKEFERSILRNKKFKETYFTQEEALYCRNRLESYAGRYAAKKAVRKALGREIPWKHINILSSRSQQPVLSLPYLESSEELSRISLSITHEENAAGAMAVTAKGGDKVSVGIDITLTSRIAFLAKKHPYFLKKVLTPLEEEKIKDPERELAMKWTGKEAVSKALGIGIWHGASLQDIEILNRYGLQEVLLKGRLAENHSINRKNWHLHFIQNDIYTLALAVAVN